MYDHNYSRRCQYGGRWEYWRWPLVLSLSFYWCSGCYLSGPNYNTVSLTSGVPMLFIPNIGQRMSMFT